MKFENGFKSLVNVRELSESGIFSQSLGGVESTGVITKAAATPKYNVIYSKYIEESGEIVNCGIFGIESGIIPSESDQRIVIKTLDGRDIIK